MPFDGFYGGALRAFLGCRPVVNLLAPIPPTFSAAGPPLPAAVAALAVWLMLLTPLIPFIPFSVSSQLLIILPNAFRLCVCDMKSTIECLGTSKLHLLLLFVRDKCSAPPSTTSAGVVILGFSGGKQRRSRDECYGRP